MINLFTNAEKEEASQSLILCMAKPEFSGALLDINYKGISFEKVKHV